MPELSLSGRRGPGAGRRISAQARTDANGEAIATTEILVSCGYEPRAEGDRIILANCPFDALAQHDRELVCGMNLEFVTAIVGEFDLPDAGVTLEPGPARCCVTLHPPIH